MQLVKFAEGPGQASRVGVLEGESVRPLRGTGELTPILAAASPEEEVRRRLGTGRAIPLVDVRLLPPVDRQEVWAAGVTYLRSRVAREQESESAAHFYDKVYTADRPELFFKATAGRVVGPGGPVCIRSDSEWSVPEPELGLVLDDTLRLVGLTIGNDMSARDIEGRNPLYLPQAKVYERSCSLGPSITLRSALAAIDDLTISLTIERDGRAAFAEETSTARMARSFDDLIDWLGRENTYPDGVVLLTGTGIVPPDDFTLRPGDLVRIAIDGLGTLENPVAATTPAR